MSLSRRLVLIVVTVSATGLAILSIVSYLALSSYLSDRADDQARASLPLVSRVLSVELGPGRLGGAERAGFPDGPQGPPRPQLPSGAYGEIRNSAGSVTASGVLAGDRSGSPTPILPVTIDAGGEPVPFDVPSSGPGPDFRVVAQELPGGSTVISAIPLADLADTLGRLRRIELLVSLAILAALGAISVVAVRGGLRPLARMEATAREIAAGDMSHRVPDPDPETEVGRLGIAFNEMLARLEHAFAEQRASESRLRQFLADASHELRTPLSSIRGYAELFRLGATANAEEVGNAMQRIESESVRMSGLVDDLLTLARLDEAPEPRREAVDLGAVADDVRANAQAMARDRAISLTAPSGLKVEGDPDQLHQLIANLVRNAIVHGEHGPIDIEVETTGGDVAVRVRDHGPGIPEGDERQIFDRFSRAGDARDRATGGAGLGLAIVAGIAVAHSGTAEARNAPDGGAIFEVRLPGGVA